MASTTSPSSDDWIRPAMVWPLAIAVLLAALAIIGADVFVHTRHGVVNAAGQQLGRDFVNHWAGARLAAHGQAARAYDIDYYIGYMRALTAANAEIKWFGYAPTAMLLALPFGLLPFVPALIAWTVAGTGLVARLIAPQLGWRLALIAAIAAPAAMFNIIGGQNGAFIAVMLAGGIALVDRRPIIAGVLFGLLTYKPHLGLLIPIALIAGGYWRTFAAAAATAVVLTVTSGLVLGWDAWAGFFANAHIHRGLLEANPGMWPRMPTVYLAGRWLGLSSALAYALQSISALAAATAVFMVWRRAAPLPVRALALIAGTFLATPYAWDYDLVVVAVGVVWYWSQARADGWRPGEKSMLAALLLAPLFTPWLALYAHLQVAPILYGLALVLIVRRALAYPQHAASPKITPAGMAAIP